MKELGSGKACSDSGRQGVACSRRISIRDLFSFFFLVILFVDLRTIHRTASADRKLVQSQLVELDRTVDDTVSSGSSNLRANQVEATATENVSKF